MGKRLALIGGLLGAAGAVLAGPFQGAGNVLGFPEEGYAFAVIPDWKEIGATFDEQATIEAWFSLDRYPKRGEVFGVLYDQGLQIEVEADDAGEPVATMTIWSETHPTPKDTHFDIVSNSFPLDLGQDTAVWHHVAVMYDGPRKEWSLAIDGFMVLGNKPMTGPLPRNPENLFLVGASWLKNRPGDTLTSFFRGRIDEVRVSSKVRYRGRRYDMPRERFAPDSATVALFRFDENPGDSVFVSQTGGFELRGHEGLSAIETPSPLTADFALEPASGNVPLAVRFLDKSKGAPAAWKWFFGDGYYSEEREPKHTYDKAEWADYNVALQVSVPGADPVLLRRLMAVRAMDSLHTPGPVRFPGTMKGRLQLPERTTSHGTPFSCEAIDFASQAPQPFTIEAWVKPDRLPDLEGDLAEIKIVDVGGTYLSLQNLGGDLAVGFHVEEMRGAPSLTGHEARAIYQYPGSYSASVHAGDWMHVAGVYDPVRHRIGVGANGRFMWDADAAIVGPVYDSGTPLALGGDPPRVFRGEIDDVSIAMRARYQDTLYPIPDAPAPLDQYAKVIYRFDSLDSAGRVPNEAGPGCALRFSAPFGIRDPGAGVHGPSARQGGLRAGVRGAVAGGYEVWVAASRPGPAVIRLYDTRGRILAPDCPVILAAGSNLLRVRTGASAPIRGIGWLRVETPGAAPIQAAFALP